MALIQDANAAVGLPRCSRALRDAALSQVIGHESTPAMEQALLDLERARVTAEDYRQGNGPAGGNCTWRRRTSLLQEDAQEMNDTLAQIAIEARGDMTTPDGGIPIWSANNIRRLTRAWAQSDERNDETTPRPQQPVTRPFSGQGRRLDE